MRKLDRSEANALAMIARIGGTYCPGDDACAEPFIMDTLRSLVRKKYLSADAVEGSPPMFRITALGQEEVAHG